MSCLVPRVGDNHLKQSELADVGLATGGHLCAVYIHVLPNQRARVLCSSRMASFVLTGPVRAAFIRPREGGIFATGSSSSNMAVTSLLLFVAQAARRLQRASHPGKVDLLAFYSSVLGGIVRDPGLMAVHIDDHMVHRCGRMQTELFLVSSVA